MKRQLVIDHLRAYPEKSIEWIAGQCHVSRSWVSAINAEEGIRKIRKRRLNGVKAGGLIGTVLRLAAEKYSVAELAHLSGLSESHIVYLRMGRYQPNLFTFECLVNALGLEITLTEKSK